MFVGGIPRSMANAELQEIFHTQAIPGRYHRKGKYGFAKILVRNSEIDRALDQDSAVFVKFRVEKWKQMAPKTPSSRAQGGLQSLRGQRYSNVASKKTAEIRMKSALRDMRWLLERLTALSPQAIHGVGRHLLGNRMCDEVVYVYRPVC